MGGSTVELPPSPVIQRLWPMLAGQWGPEGLEYTNGRAARNVSVSILTESGDLATLYSDVDRTSVVANPTHTDSLGNLTFYADPGEYVMSVFGAELPVSVIGGGNQGTFGTLEDVDFSNAPIGPDLIIRRVSADEWETAPAPAGLSGGSFHHVQLASDYIWHIVHSLGFRPNITTKDSVGDIVEPADIQHAPDLLSSDVYFGRPMSGEADLS